MIVVHHVVHHMMMMVIMHHGMMMVITHHGMVVVMMDDDYFLGLRDGWQEGDGGEEKPGRNKLLKHLNDLH